MRVLRRSAVLVLAAFAMLGGNTLHAAIAAQMNLEQLVTEADRVFLGTVIDMSESRVEFGGGQLPAVTYRLQVNDTFKGRFEEIKGKKFTEVTMLGSIKHVKSGSHPISDFPLLREGTVYRLMIAPAGPTGLTAPMGLGQGCFVVSGEAGGKAAMNGAHNAGLFAGMNVSTSDGAAVPYDELAAAIRGIVGGTQ